MIDRLQCQDCGVVYPFWAYHDCPISHLQGEERLIWFLRQIREMADEIQQKNGGWHSWMVRDLADRALGDGTWNAPGVPGGRTPLGVPRETVPR